MPSLMRQRYEVDEFDQDKVREIAATLCDPLNCNIEMRSKSFEAECTQTDEWFGTKFCYGPIPDDMLNKMRNPNCEIKSKKLDLPPRNNLIPKNFDILPPNEAFSKQPVLLKQYDDTHVWYHKDDKFEKPKGVVRLKLYTNDNRFGFDVNSRLFFKIWEEVTTEFLREFSYMAQCANLNFAVNILHDNIDFSWAGFNDSMPNYITESLEKISKMKEADVEGFFNQVKEKLTQEWTNAYLDQSYIQGIGDEFDYMTYANVVEKKDLNKALQSYTYD